MKLVLGSFASLVLAVQTLYAVPYAYFADEPSVAVGRFQLGNTNCTAFLSGPQQITTAGHCIQYGHVDEGYFYLNYNAANPKHGSGNGNFSNGTRKEGYFRPITKFTGFYMTGGGFDRRAQLKGTDWAHIHIKERLGDIYGYLDISNAEVATGTTVKIASYMESRDNGNYAYIDECRVEDPPADLRESCTPLPGGNFNCNFYIINCPDFPNNANMASGAPITARIDGREVVVGIYTGVGRIVEKVGTRRNFDIAITVNESLTPDANVIFHAFNMRIFTALNRISTVFLNGRSATTTFSRADPLATRLQNLLERWRPMSDARGVEEIQWWDTMRAQRSVMTLINQYLTQTHEQRNQRQIRFTINTEREALHNDHNTNADRPQFGQYYANQRPVTSVTFNRPQNEQRYAPLTFHPRSEMQMNGNDLRARMATVLTRVGQNVNELNLTGDMQDANMNRDYRLARFEIASADARVAVRAGQEIFRLQGLNIDFEGYLDGRPRAPVANPAANMPLVWQVVPVQPVYLVPLR